MRGLLVLGAALLAVWQPAAAGESTRVAQILERFERANQWRDHVMVAAHRGGWKEGGRMLYAENSREVVRRAISLGAEVVEIDVRKTRDGVLVVLHDSWLDRTTTCRGRLAEKTLAEIADCRLKIEGSGEVTDEPVPTLSDILAETRDKILVNIDNKLGPDSLPDIAALARELGMADQIIIKQNLWSRAKIAEAQKLLKAVGEGVRFMPILADDAVREPAFIEAASKPFAADAVELINWRAKDGALTRGGGTLFSARARAVAARGDWHLWVNTYSIVNKTGGLLAGGRGDELAVLAGAPEEVYGFWVDRGATIIQTDEPKAAIEWLQENGYRVPYDLTN